MTISAYDALVPALLRGLSTLQSYLDRAQELSTTRRIPIDAILTMRIAPDMLTFAEQIDVAARKAMRHSAALARFETIQPAPSEASVAALRERINEAINFIGALPADVIANAETHAFELSMPIVRGWIGGADYIFQLVLPDFFFHVSMAHAILRQLGAPIGKRDYLGALTITAGGYR